MKWLQSILNDILLFIDGPPEAIIYAVLALAIIYAVKYQPPARILIFIVCVIFIGFGSLFMIN